MKNISVAFIFCHLVFFGSCQIIRSMVQEVVIPMDMSTYRPIVEIMIDGRGPYKFIFDTGSSANVIDKELCETSGFEVTGEDPLRTPGSENRLMSKRVFTPNVSFPGTTISLDAEMNVIPLKELLNVDGILGGFFVKDYLATMDYPGSKLILAKGSLDENDKDVISFIQNPRNLNMYIDVDGNRVEAHLDTGNPNTITLPYSLKDKLTFKEAPVKGSPLRTPVASFETWNAELIGNIKIGNVVFKNSKVILAEGWGFTNVGYGMIKNMRTTIDRKNSLIKFEQQTPVDLSGRKMAKQEGAQSSSTYAGTYDGERKIWMNESGEWMYQREGAPIGLKLVRVSEDLYEMEIPNGVRSPREIPKVFFVRNGEKMITGIELVFKDGKRDGPYKRYSD